MCMYKTLVEFAASADFPLIVKKGIDGYLQPEGACSSFNTLCEAATILKEAFKILHNYIANGLQCNEPRYYFKGLPRRKEEIVSAFKALDLIKQTTTN